ncbi:hypothetical protein [Spirosoma koreense]
MNVFSESQRFRQWWLWIFLAVVTGITVSGAYVDPTAWFGIVVALLIDLLFYVWRLDTRLDEAGIHYRVFPILPWRTIAWSRVRAVSVCSYGFIGYGIRLGFDGWVYNVAGNKGLRIVFTDNHRITIGTQRPDELQHFLDQQQVPRPELKS